MLIYGFFVYFFMTTTNIFYMQLTDSNANVQDDARDEENQQHSSQAMHKIKLIDLSESLKV